jgi:CheY-like chemotaxis protein
MKKIIFADDDAAIQDVVSLIFEDEYEVVCCMNGDSLLKHAPLYLICFLSINSWVVTTDWIYAGS